MALGRVDELIDAVAELDERDRRMAERIASVTGLADGVERVRSEAARLGGALASLPDERSVIARSRETALRAERVARDDLEAAERRLDAVERRRRPGEEELARVRSEARTAREQLSDAEHRIERLRTSEQQLDAAEQTLSAEARELAAEAARLADAVAAEPRVASAGSVTPDADLAAVAEWASRERAALFVARGTLETERERIVAEANALGAAVLGEQPPGSSVALVRSRVEEALA
jgi:chromosome segregation ATPase